MVNISTQSADSRIYQIGIVSKITCKICLTHMGEFRGPKAPFCISSNSEGPPLPAGSGVQNVKIICSPKGKSFQYV